MPGIPAEENIPRIRPVRLDTNGVPALEEPPEPFMERILQTRLAYFWLHAPSCKQEDSASDYDLLRVQDYYDTFCSKYIASLPQCFDLGQPDRRWDEQVPKLSSQRGLLHITIYGTLCRHFRPALLQDTLKAKHWPRYKIVLLESQRRLLAAAAIEVQTHVESFYALTEDSHHRLVIVIFATFEAVISLLSLLNLEDQHFLESNESNSNNGNSNNDNGASGIQSNSLPSIIATTDPLIARSTALTPYDCWQAVDSALSRLETLAVTSTLAETGARIAARLKTSVRERSLESRSLPSSSQGPVDGPLPFEPYRQWTLYDNFAMDTWQELFLNASSGSSDGLDEGY